MLGEILKKKREESGLDLKEVAHDLRIQYMHLTALENNDLEKLPPDVYTKSYIREYARFLKIDPEPLIAEYKEYLMRQNPETKPEDLPLKKKFIIPRVYFLIPVVLAVVAVFVTYFSGIESVKKEGEIVSLNTPSVVHEEERKAAASAPSISPYNVLSIVAMEDAWLRVETEDGKSEEVLMRPGETKKWTSKNGFNLKLGNAGGVKLVLNDRDIGTPGEKGQVLRLKLPQ